jgi:hypothetical protein
MRWGTLLGILAFLAVVKRPNWYASRLRNIPHSAKQYPEATMLLFQQNDLASVLQSKLGEAIQIVNAQPLTELSNPALAGSLEKLWTTKRPSIPRLFVDRKTGARRQTKRRINDYGREVEVEQTVLDVSIPYEGDGNFFYVRPSTCNIIDEPFIVDGDHLTCTMAFEPAQEAHLAKLLERLEQNLARLRSEEEAFSRTAVARLNEIAALRRVKLEQEEKTASSFSFPIR